MNKRTGGLISVIAMLASMLTVIGLILAGLYIAGI